MILDVGCGHLQNHYARGSINVDILKPQKRISNFIQCDAHYLPFKQETFTECYFYDVIEHVENPSRCLKEIKYVLKRFGKVYISTPNVLHYRKFQRVLRNKPLVLSSLEHISAWSHIEFENLAHYVGLKVVRKYYTILPSTEKTDGQKHILIDKLMFKILPSSVSGRNMIFTLQKVV